MTEHNDYMDEIERIAANAAHQEQTTMKRTSGIERVDIDGLVTIRMADGTTMQTTRILSFEVDVNGPGSSQFTSSLPVPRFADFQSPFGMVDSAHPLIREFVDRILDVSAAPSRDGKDQTFDVPARPDASSAEAAD